MNLKKSNQINILFIGNSFTYYNDMTKTVEQMGINNGYDLHVDHIAYGGFSLSQYIGSSPEALEVMDKINSIHWDYVVLQEHSRKPLDNKKEFLSSVILLDEMIKKQDGKTILYSTWSYRNETERLRSTGLTYDAFYKVLKEGYEEAGNEINSLVAPVGSAFNQISKEHSNIDLLVNDDFHPSIEGSYVAALIFYSIIFGDNNNQYVPEGISEKDILILQKAALKVV